MVDLTRRIKEIVQGYLNNESLSDLVYATYTGGGLKVDSKPLPIPADMVDLPERLRRLEGEEALKSGDRVAVLRKRGGQRYFILDRI